MKKLSLAVVGMVLALGLLIKPVWTMSCHGGDGMDMSHDDQKNTDKKAEIESFNETVYSCPMHPEVRSDQSGKCPKCGMNLEAKQVTKYRLKKDRPVEQAAADKNSTIYACPMHPEIQSDKPSQCSKCGMNLEKKQPSTDSITTKQDKTADGTKNQEVNNNQSGKVSDNQQVTKKDNALKKTVSKNNTSVKYQCPMHPEVTSDKPGKCSKCGMFLEKK